ncbi:MAG: hypothetical protein RSF93_05380 [Mucinivorans sp.]
MRRLILLLISLVLLTACAFEYKYSRSIDLNVDQDSQSWTKGQNAIFHFSSLFGAAPSDISVFIRLRGQLNVDNPRLIVKTIDPDGVFWEDTVVMPYVRGGADNKFVETSFVKLREGVRWKKTGKYALSVRPVDSLSGVMAVGVEVSNVTGDDDTSAI